MNVKKLKFDSRLIHSNGDDDQYGSLVPPIYMSSTFPFNNFNDMQEAFEFKKMRYVYTRGGNPTINLLEKRMTELEKGVGSVAFASGMAAISNTLLSLLKPGDTILAHNDLYGSSFGIMEKLLPKFNINTNFIDMTDFDSIEQNIVSNTKVIYLESPTNPMLEILDLQKIFDLAKNKNVITVIDNTFATPFLQKPLKFGADVVIHSATKYLSGHGDVLGGVVVANDVEYLHKLKFDYMCELGGVISPFNAWLILRGIKTLSLRMKRHCESAAVVADFLQQHPKVEKVVYPGLMTHEQHNLAKEQMQNGFGGVVTFELCGNDIQPKKFIGKLKLLQLSVSLGDAETLVSIPSMMSHKVLTNNEGILKFSDKTIRLSVGLEDVTDILSDIEGALE